MPDIIIYEDQRCELETQWGYMYTSPIAVYFRNSKRPYPFKVWHTGNYRGYLATWELTNDMLYLVEIKGETAKLGLTKVFPDIKFKDKIRASWYSGILWVKTGRYKKYYGKGKSYSIGYKTYVFIRFKEGKVEKKITLTEEEYQKAYRIYLKRKYNNNPVKKGPFFEYDRYINSCLKEYHKKKKEKTQNRPDEGDNS